VSEDLVSRRRGNGALRTEPRKRARAMKSNTLEPAPLALTHVKQVLLGQWGAHSDKYGQNVQQVREWKRRQEQSA
jgi:hypothetical protein